MEKIDAIQKARPKEKAEDRPKLNPNEKLVDVGTLDIRRMLRALGDVKKQNAQLFDAIKRINKHDKNFEAKINDLFHIASNIRSNTEREMASLERFLRNVEDNKVDEKYMERIATINKPNRESIKYGQNFITLRKSFLNMAVKRASEKSKENDSGGEQS